MADTDIAAPSLLLVEDDDTLIAGLTYALDREGYAVQVARTLADARPDMRAADLVLLDVMLPDGTGFELLQELRGGQDRESGPAVIMLTARDQEPDKVRGLDLGADDYVTKPFGLAELLARVRAQLRRRGRAGPEGPTAFTIGEVSVDLSRLTVTRAGQTESLTMREAGMLQVLWLRRGRVVSREAFLSEVWGFELPPPTRTVDQHVARLRRKLEIDPADPQHLRTVHGMGYRLDP